MPKIAPSRRLALLGLLASAAVPASAEDYAGPFEYADPKPQAYQFAERASKIDPRVRSHPAIKFVLEKDGKPADLQRASVDTRVKPRGKLVIALMGAGNLFRVTNALGLHAIQVPYANGWFEIIRGGDPKDSWRGNVRLEAATGEDHSPLIDIPKPDGLAERSLQFVKWLAKTHPQGKWDHFLVAGGDDLKWEDVILVGLSHGATTAARLAMHKKVDRAVFFSGPRDQDQSWQSGPSATPANRFFGFTHVLDGGWAGKHYCRSWELLGMHKSGPVVDVEKTKAPFGNTRRLITTIEGKGSMKFHNGVAPNVFAWKDAEGRFVHEEVWRYLFTHPVDRVGEPVEPDPACRLKKK